MQQEQLPTLAVLGGTGPALGKKNSISRAAAAGLSDPCTALKVVSGEGEQGAGREREKNIHQQAGQGIQTFAKSRSCLKKRGLSCTCSKLNMLVVFA